MGGCSLQQPPSGQQRHFQFVENPGPWPKFREPPADTFRVYLAFFAATVGLREEMAPASFRRLPSQVVNVIYFMVMTQAAVQ